MVDAAVHELLAGVLATAQGTHDAEFDARGPSVGIQSFVIVATTLWGPRIRKYFGLPDQENVRMTRAERWTLIGAGVLAGIGLVLVAIFWGPEYPIALIVGLIAAVTISAGCLVLRKYSPKEEVSSKEEQ